MAKIKIRTQFLLLFILIGTIPLLIIETLFFYQASNIIKSNAFDHVNAIHDVRNSEILDDMEHRLHEFLAILESDVVPNNYDEVENYYAGQIHSVYSDYIYSFLKSNGFSNFYIVNSGNNDFLYAYNSHDGYYGDSGLQRVVDKAMMSDTYVFEDFGDFEPVPESKSAFIAKSIRDKDGYLLCTAVVLLTDTYIDSLMDSVEGLGDSGESYLISHNKESDKFELRSNLITMGNGKYIVGYKWNKENLSYWNRAVDAGIPGGFSEAYDSENKHVLVSYNKLDVPYLNWYLITKIDEAEIMQRLNYVLIVSVGISILLLVFIGILSIVFSNKLTTPIIKGAEFAKSIAEGHFDTRLDIRRKDEIGTLAKALREMGRSLSDLAWIRKGREGLDDQLRGEHDIKKMGDKFISFMVKHLDAQLGALYLIKDDDTLYLSSSYAFSDRDGNFNTIGMGEGLVGQAAFEKNQLVFTNVPASDAPAYNYGVASLLPTTYIATPLVFEDELIAVSLIGITAPVKSLQLSFIDRVKESVAILINSAKTGSFIQALLEDAQVKQEELRVSNEELEQQTEALKDSEKDLQAQQEELRVTNEELQERTKALEEQRLLMKKKNEDLEEIGKDLEKKAVELERASRYKSEFLANMSHELRTPLNSILILSQLLSGNKKGNLDENQIKSASAINSSGEDLLKLINEILDLSKVESGKVELSPENVTIESLIEDLKRVYDPISKQRGITFNIDVDKTLPENIITDSHRLQQVLRNLLTNAFKFSDQGGCVELNIARNRDFMDFNVIDNGIGIEESKQELVFEAFKQADGSTSRKYGGTGLGLSISRELAKLLGGDITLKSVYGKGSTFTVSIPIKEGTTVKVDKETLNYPLIESVVKDDRSSLKDGRKRLLIIEDDNNFATILKDEAHNKGFDVLVAEDGETGLHFADYYNPSGIILDKGLPGIDGFEVLDRLKSDPILSKIPVHLISGAEDSEKALEMGAIGYEKKPLSIEGIKGALDTLISTMNSNLRKLLIVEDDDLQRTSIESLIEGSDVEILSASSGQEAYSLIKENNFDCIVLDLGLKDMSGYDLLDHIKESSGKQRVPVIVYTGRDMTREEELSIKKYTDSIIIKGVKSPERLLEETSLFLHRVGKDKLAKIESKEPSRVSKDVLSGKNVLIVDDDVRNIFALTSILEDHNINVLVAKDGVESLDVVKENSDIDLILMDIMMPNMDGYEAIRHIRKRNSLKDLPIIALTANAMKGDRNKCIDAGANDYLAKPVDNEKLLSMLRVWLYK